MKITRYVHRPNITELGMGNTHETYLLISCCDDLLKIFPNGVPVTVTDTVSRKQYPLTAKKDESEFRINQFGQLFRDNDVRPGDEIHITCFESIGKQVFVQAVKRNRVVLYTTNNGSEVSNIELLDPYKKADRHFIIPCALGKVDIAFSITKKKRSDSPTETDFYKVELNGTAIEKGYLYIDIADKCSISSLPKYEYSEYELDDPTAKEEKSDERRIIGYNKVFFGTPGSGKSHKVNEIVKGNDEFTFRTTFHPDSDYASFVGSYKPITDGKNISYEFVPQAFTNAYVAAWKNPEKAVYLVIEEINRGNCAQIFGDLFQLLDRDTAGWSEYPIKADSDLRHYLENIDVLGTGSEGIKNGEISLPGNLSILATMNTSDQSLFPMDSAFKRRWNWEFVPSDPKCADSKFTITIGDKKYGWPEFMTAANERILKLSESEDKQMGNFFIKANLNEEEFKSKVMFYLWSEVCKDYYKSGSFFKNAYKGNDEFTFNELFPKNEETTAILQGFMAHLNVKSE